jgi:hypothetical protein
MGEEGGSPNLSHLTGFRVSKGTVSNTTHFVKEKPMSSNEEPDYDSSESDNDGDVTLTDSVGLARDPVSNTVKTSFVVGDPSKLNFDDLRVGEHIKLRCGCEGWISELSGADLSFERWFRIMVTMDNCQRKMSLENFYREETGNTVRVIISSEFGVQLPASPKSPPSWYPRFDSPPDPVRYNRAIAVKFADGITFMIPGALIQGDIYDLSNFLRSMFIKTGMGNKGVNVAVAEYMSPVNANSFRDFISRAPMTLEEINRGALYDWLISQLRVSAPGTMIDGGVSPIPKDKVRDVLLSVKANRLWNRNPIRVISDDHVILLDSDGTIPEEIS